jgi:hypothetical protein
MTTLRTVLRVSSLLLLLTSSASAQFRRPPVERIAKLSGPRFGVTVLGGGITDRLRREFDVDISPVITQFGWQAETQFGGGGGDIVGVTELVMLAGGLEQNQFLPSVSWLVGFRTASGYELGVGPNVTAVSSALAVAGGYTRRYGNLNVPLNVAIVPSSSGLRVSILAGFNMAQ